MEFRRFAGRLSHVNDENIFNFEEVEARERSPHLIPWIVTGAIAVIAILVSLIVMNLAKGDADQAADPTPPVTQTPDEQPEPEPEPEPTPEPEPEPEEPAVDPDRPDDALDTSGVTIGDTFLLDVGFDWNMTTEVPNKFGLEWRYVLEDMNWYLVLQHSDLINSLPDSCAAQRAQWGLEKLDDGSFRAYSPQEMCEENESLYIELLGLVRHMEKTAQAK